MNFTENSKKEIKERRDYFNRCCDKTYIAVTLDGFSFKGILLNYNSGNIILFNEKDETICHIPFKDLETLRPAKKNIKE